MRAHIAVLSLAFALPGCLISGYGERRPPDEDAALPGETRQDDLDAGTHTDLDGGRDAQLDARAPVVDAQVDLPEEDGGSLTSVEAWCASHPCGQVLGCSSNDCALSCGGDAYQVDAGRSVDCTFDCTGADHCTTACDTSLSCQTSCLGASACQNTCKVGASCNVYCGGARCGGSCESGSSCAFTCPASGCEAVVCKAGARCILRCDSTNTTNTDNTSCSFSACEAQGGQQRCGSGRTVVCGRPCPMR